MPSVIQESPPDQLPADNLHVNDGPLAASDIGYLKPSYPDEPLEVLRQRYEADGYVLLKGVLPRADVLQAREAYFAFLASTGVLKPGSAPVDGLFDSAKDKADYPGIGAGGPLSADGTSPAERFVDLALQAHTQPWYIDFCQHPALLDFVGRFSGWGDRTLSVKRTLLRNNTPGNKAIGVHYDQIFMRHGEPTAVTAWVPMGDVSINGGGLIYLENGKGHSYHEPCCCDRS
jgi:phytanoyl-CoA hydroxylase